MVIVIQRPTATKKYICGINVTFQNKQRNSESFRDKPKNIQQNVSKGSLSYEVQAHLIIIMD